MNLNKANMAVVKVASKDATRFVLTGIKIEPGCTIACDGAMVARVTLPEQIPEGALVTGLVSRDSVDWEGCTVMKPRVKPVRRDRVWCHKCHRVIGKELALYIGQGLYRCRKHRVKTILKEDADV